MSTAWRKPVEGGQKDLAVSIKLPKDGKPEDPTVAVFEDKQKHEIPDLTVEAWQTMTSARSRSAAASSNIYWKGEHLATHNKLVVTTFIEP